MLCLSASEEVQSALVGPALEAPGPQVPVTVAIAMRREAPWEAQVALALVDSDLLQLCRPQVVQ